MKRNSDRFKRLTSFFDEYDRRRMRLEWCARFNKSEQTYYNKARETEKNRNSFFDKDEIEWLENWAKENGMPDSEIQEIQTKSVTE